MSERERLNYLPRCVKLSYGVGHFLNDLCASMWFSYFLVFFHFVLNFSNNMAGVLLLIGQVADAVATPFIGFETDRWKSGLCHYGKRKSWHLIGTCCVVFSFPFLFNKCIGCIQLCDPSFISNQLISNCYAQFIYYIPFVVIFQFGWASVQISHLSIIPELSPSNRDRVELTSIRNIFTVIASITVYLIAWCLFYTDPTSTKSQCSPCAMNDTSITPITPSDSTVFQILVSIVVVTGVVFQIVFHCGTPEKSSNSRKLSSSLPEVVECLVDNEEIHPQIMTWKAWFKEIQFYQIGLLYMITRLAVNLSQIYISMFITVTLHLAKHYIAIIPLVVYISGFTVSLLLRPINAVFGRKLTYMIGALLIILSSIWTWILSGNSNSYMQIFGSAILLGFGNSIILVNSLSMTADMIGLQTHSGAFVYGCMSFTDKISNGLAVVAIQYFHPCSSAAACPVISSKFYRKTMSFIPGGLAVLSILFLATLSTVKIGKLKTFKNYPGYYERFLLQHMEKNEVPNWITACWRRITASNNSNTVSTEINSTNSYHDDDINTAT